ncbi:MAG TPA: sigma-70 family RNA polymerase sigma factor [Chthonomonadaceae bacterium]|nr:sigma-70 family RNA polymerase sigma factor [Chthonomonadaceae bacterium]
MKGTATVTLAGQLEEPCRVAAARQGEPAALEWLFQTYHGAIYALCYRLLSRPEDAEDATQATFVAAFRSLPTFRGDSSVRTWLYRIASNEAMTILRRRRTAPADAPREELQDNRAPDALQRAAVSAAMRRMQPDKRLILALHYWEELSCDEIAAVLGVSISAAKMRLKRAREEFQRHYGGEP